MSTYSFTNTPDGAGGYRHEGTTMLSPGEHTHIRFGDVKPTPGVSFLLSNPKFVVKTGQVRMGHVVYDSNSDPLQAANNMMFLMEIQGHFESTVVASNPGTEPAVFEYSVDVRPSSST